MNLDNYIDQFLRLKDDFIRDARVHKVSAANLLAWMKDHLTPEEYADAGALGFASREEEFAFFLKATHHFRKSDAVQSFLTLLRRVGRTLNTEERKAFIHALGDALDPDGFEGADADHARKIKYAMKDY